MVRLQREKRKFRAATGYFHILRHGSDPIHRALEAGEGLAYDGSDKEGFGKVTLLGSVWKNALLLAAGVVIALAAGWYGLHKWRTRPGPGRMRDEARMNNRGAFAEADDDYFRDMDGGVDLDIDEMKGRNVWMLWSAGNDRFWDWLARYTGGEFDLLKIVSSYNPDKDRRISAADRDRLRALYGFRRENRVQILGVTNEPCFDQAREAIPRNYGLWLDQRQPNCRPDPFQEEQKYMGVPAGMRGRTIPLGSAYGMPSGIVGLRIFPNPDFNDAAAAKWDAVRYYADPSYYGSRDLVRPYRIGMTCAFCHAGWNPAKLPDDPSDPKWENLSSTAGAQYLRMGRLAMWSAAGGNFFQEALNSARAGTLDTSLVVSDHIFNPRAIHPIYGLAARMKMAREWGKETLGGASLANRQVSTYVAGGPLAAFFEEPATVWTPRMGVDAMDSVGILGAINRKFPALGMFSEEWLLHFNPLIGGKPQMPVDMKAGRSNSSYWQATEEVTPDVVRFLMKIDVPQVAAAAAPASADRGALGRGKIVFAERCASCHSSKFPAPPDGANPGNCEGSYTECWDRYRAWTKTAEYGQQMRAIVLADDFLKDNFLSNDVRVPLPAVGTNACIALSSNGTAGQMWEQFTSKTYRDLPSAGAITVYHPYTGAKREFKLPGGGRGYLRPPSLAGMWYTAPYLATNSVGKFEPRIERAARMAAFEESIGELLWPERREPDAVLGANIPGKIDRTGTPTTIRLPARVVPDGLSEVLEGPSRFLPHFSEPAAAEIGPIPAGTPVGLLANLNLLDPRAAPLLLKIKKGLKAGGDFAKYVDPLLELSACPDLVVNRGHYFGTGLDGEPALTDQQKRDLIEFLRTM